MPRPSTQKSISVQSHLAQSRFCRAQPARFVKYGTAYTNQYSNVWSGALAYLNLPGVGPDKEISSLLEQRFADSIEAFQSPAGYFYESNGSDFRYSLRTHDNNLAMALHYAAGSPMGDELIAKIERYATWFSWNAVPETKDLFFINRSIEMRKFLPVKTTGRS